MTSKAHRRYWLAKIKQAAYVPCVLAASAALCIAVAKVWNYLWAILLTPP